MAVDALLALLGGTTALTFVFLVIARRAFGVPYPLNRTALYFIPIASLTLLALVVRLKWRPAILAAVALAALVSTQYVLQMDFRIYAEWYGEAGAKAMIQCLIDDAGDRPIRIGTSDSLEHVVNFYRERYRQRNWAEAERKRDGSPDYLVLERTDFHLLRERRLEVLYRDLNLALARPSHD